jgi:hypothetical protein
MKSKLLVSLAAAALTAAAFAAISVAQNGDSDDRPEGDVRAAPGAPMMFHHRIAPSSERERAAMEEFRKCMADNGADLPEPPDLGEMRRGEMPAHPEPPTEEEIEALRKAHEACEDKLPEGAEFGIARCDDDGGEDESGEDEGPREENGAESGAESEGAAA